MQYAALLGRSTGRNGVRLQEDVGGEPHREAGGQRSDRPAVAHLYLLKCGSSTLESEKSVSGVKTQMKPNSDVNGASFMPFMCWQMSSLTCSVCACLCFGPCQRALNCSWFSRLVRVCAPGQRSQPALLTRWKECALATFPALTPNCPLASAEAASAGIRNICATRLPVGTAPGALPACTSLF